MDSGHRTEPGSSLIEALLGEVVFEETGETRAIVKGCGVCKPTPEQMRTGWVIVSPGGVAHHNKENDDHTYCGHDATLNGWWWPS